MKRFHTTIKTVGALKTSIDNSRAAGIFKNGETDEEFADNVAAYIDYCEEYGCRVTEAARPSDMTLAAWYGEALAEERYQELVRIYGPRVERGLFVVEYNWPDGSGSWVQCSQEHLWTEVRRFEHMGCQVSINGL